MKRKLSNKTPEYMPPPAELDLNSGIVNMRGLDVDAWTTEQALLTSLNPNISLAVVGAQTAYRVNNANCRLGEYIFKEALITMSNRADIGYRWFSNYVVHDIMLYASVEPQEVNSRKTAYNVDLPGEENGPTPTLPELVAKQFNATQVIAARPSSYIGKTGFVVITAFAGSANEPSKLRITFNNQMFASMRFIENDMLPIITPKSGAIRLNGAVFQANEGKEAIGKIPVACTEFDGMLVMPDVSYFDTKAIVMFQLDGNKISRVKITTEMTPDELNTWRLRNFGESLEMASNSAKYRLDTTDGITARVRFNQSDIYYDFEKTERA